MFRNQHACDHLRYLNYVICMRIIYEYDAYYPSYLKVHMRIDYEAHYSGALNVHMRTEYETHYPGILKVHMRTD